MIKHLALVGTMLMAAALTLLACVCLPWIFADTSPPTISRLKSSPSPDAELVATVFVETGGGAAGFSRPNVVAHPVGTVFDAAEKLLVDGSYLNVDARWLSNRLLEVSYSHVHQASNRRPSTMGVRVVYKEK